MPAGFFQRIAALVFDVLVQFLLVYLVLPPVFGLTLPESIRGHALAGAFVVTLVFYEPIQVALFGRTLGHRYRGIRVVDAETGGRIGFPRAFVRMVIKSLLGLWSFLAMLGARKQAVHDHLTGSKVVTD